MVAVMQNSIQSVVTYMRNCAIHIGISNALKNPKYQNKSQKSH